jgi:hypothetical protein
VVSENPLASQGFKSKGRNDAGYRFSVPGSGVPLTHPRQSSSGPEPPAEAVEDWAHPSRVAPLDDGGSISAEVAYMHQSNYSGSPPYPSKLIRDRFLFDNKGNFRPLGAGGGPAQVRAHSRDGGRVHVDAHDRAPPARS